MAWRPLRDPHSDVGVRQCRAEPLDTSLIRPANAPPRVRQVRLTFPFSGLEQIPATGFDWGYGGGNNELGGPVAGSCGKQASSRRGMKSICHYSGAFARRCLMQRGIRREFMSPRSSPVSVNRLPLGPASACRPLFFPAALALPREGDGEEARAARPE
jgi:hypothetical protein